MNGVENIDGMVIELPDDSFFSGLVKLRNLLNGDNFSSAKQHRNKVWTATRLPRNQKVQQKTKNFSESWTEIFNCGKM